MYGFAKYFVVLASVVACISASSSSKEQISEVQECPEHEVYNECGSGCGDPSCDISLDIILACRAACKPGCFCEDGYVRNENAVCVLKESCPVKCGKNEEYTTCARGCGDGSCINPTNAGLICTADCKEGCYCKEGFVRENGECIAVNECPQNKCGPNESYNECGPSKSCEGNCQNPYSYGKTCRDECVKGCSCDFGFVRHLNGKCIPVENCRARCGRNQVYSDCSNACPPTCAKPNLIMCRARCRPGCICKKGFLWSSSGKCIAQESCPKPQVCAAGEVAVKCANPCPPTCLLPNRLPCPTFACSPGCECKAGYIRDSTGKCIVLQKCPATSKVCTRKSEIYNDCGSACGDFDCATFGQPRGCTKNCQPGCFCKPDFVRNENNQCVPASSCLVQTSD